MSLEFLHAEIRKALEAEAAKLANNSINLRFTDQLTADQYAMLQAQNLATAFGLTVAAGIVTREYKKMTEPQDKRPENENDTESTKRRPLYG